MGDGGSTESAVAWSVKPAEKQASRPIIIMTPNGGVHGRGQNYFKMPLHYPRYTRADYETMPEWKLDCLLQQYGLAVTGDLAHKRDFAMGTFLWPPH